MDRLYVASNASPARQEMWKRYRAEGYLIVSTWIDEGGKETINYYNLWERIYREITIADRLILYATPEDFQPDGWTRLKGAYVETGIALGQKKPVTICLPGINYVGPSFRPIGSWVSLNQVTRIDDIYEALRNQFGEAVSFA